MVGGAPFSHGGAYPHPDLGWGTSHPDLGRGIPHPGWITPPPRPGTGYCPTQTWDGVPHLGWGTPPTQTWDGVPPPRPRMGYPSPLRPEMGYPPHPRKCGQTETITFPHPSDAGGNNAETSRFPSNWLEVRGPLRP